MSAIVSTSCSAPSSARPREKSSSDSRCSRRRLRTISTSRRSRGVNASKTLLTRSASTASERKPASRPRKVRAHLARGGEDYQLTVCRGQSALGTKVGLGGGDALREFRHVNQRPKRPARTAASHNAVPDGLIFGRK